VGAVSGLGDVVDDNVRTVKMVGLVGAGERDDTTNGEVHRGGRVGGDHGVDRLAENGLGARVGSLRVRKDGDNNLEVVAGLG